MNDEEGSRCKGFTRTGDRCRNPALPGQEYCHVHRWQAQFRDPQRLKVWGLVIAALSMIAAVVQATTGVIAVLPSFREQATPVPSPTATPLAFATAEGDEVLIIVTQLDDRSDGKHGGIDPGQRIFNTIAEKVATLSPSPRVQFLQEVVADQQEAREVLEHYRATLLIRGWYDAIGAQPIVEINKEQIGLPRMGEETNLATPDAIVFSFQEDLPGQASYLSFLSLGLIRVGEQAYIQAADHFTSAIDSLPKRGEPSINPWEAYVWRANVYSWLEEYDRAIADYDQCLKLHPHREAYFNRGGAHRSNGDDEAAIADYTKAIEIDPEYKEAYVSRGNCHGRLGDHKGAIADYTKAIEIDPEYKEAYVNRGAAHGSNGEYEAAIADYTKAIEIDPEYASTYFNRAHTRSTTGDDEAAIADYTKAIEIDPEYKEAYVSRGNCHGRLGDHKAAIADYTKAIEIDPEYASAYFNRGYHYNEIGDFEEAASDLEEYLQRNPNADDRAEVEAWIAEIREHSEED